MTTAERRAAGGETAPPRPRLSPLKGYDPIWLLAVNMAVIAFMWFLHGGLERTEDQGWLIAVGQLSGLYAGVAVLLGLVLISRTPWLERRYGMDRMVRFHRYVGFTAALLMVIHIVSVTIGYAWDSDITIWEQIVDSVLHYPYLANAVIGFALLVVVAVSSLRVLRTVLAYEHWWFLHVAAYVGVALVFGHQTAVGSDFVTDPWALAYWTLLYVSAAAVIVGYRWITPFLLAFRHRFVVVAVEVEGPDVVTVAIGGRHLNRLPAQAGQFFLIRTLAPGSWWKAHPFSLSAPPDGRTLRFTIKALGDDTTALQTIPLGTRCSLEGPYGGFLPVRSGERKILYIAGGIGITPFRGLIDDFDRPEDVILLYRSRSPKDTVFLADLLALSEARGFELHLSYSSIPSKDPNPFERQRLESIAPDIASREVFVSGSPRLVSAARDGLRSAGVPIRQIHFENFAY